MSRSDKNLALIILLVASLCPAALSVRELLAQRDDKGAQSFLLQKMEVYVQNYLEDKSDFTIHCKSKDDDLGTRVVKSGHSYSWKFRINVWGSTLFFCGVSTTQRSGVFDLYDAPRDKNGVANTVSWLVKKDGVHKEHSDIIYRWA